MAIIDYGAIGFKNGKLISTDMFTPMEQTCGFSDANNLLPLRKSSFDGNNFLVIGDREWLIGFYKTCITWWHDCFKDETDPKERYCSDGEWFGFSEYTKWKRWEKFFSLNEKGFVEIVVKPKNGYYVAYFKYNGDKYKVCFGYGVDLDFYKKTGRVNYYRSPEYFITNIFYKLKRKFTKH